MQGDRGAELNFDGKCTSKHCTRDAVVGQTKCRLHRDQNNQSHRATRIPLYSGLTKPSELYPRPAWMSDPSLLPKRPPGREA